MNNPKKILLICREFDQSHCLAEIVESSEKRFVVASDDIRVHKLAGIYPNVADTVWMSQMDSIFSVSNEVIAIINAVNDWYKAVAGGHRSIKDLLYWPMHCEGGPTSQRVLDFLLLERSYELLIATQNPAEIIIINDPVTTWENELLIAIAHKREIQVRVVGILLIKQWLRKNIWLHIRPFAVGVFKTFQIVKAKSQWALQTRSAGDDSGVVAIQLASSSKNHQNHTKVLARALRDEGLDPIILGWQLGASAGDLKHEGFKFINLEQGVRLADVLLVWYRVLISRWLAGRRIKPLLRGSILCANPQVLQSTLARSVLDFYFSELLQRALLKCASRRYFISHKVSALRPHSLILPVSAILFREFRRALPHAVVFINGGWPYNLPEPITDSEAPIPRNQVVFCACSDLHRKSLIDKGFRSENVIVTGLHWVESIMDFAQQTTKQQSRATLGLPIAKWFVLLDVNATLLGYQAAQEQQSVLSMVLDFAKTNPDCFIMVKPHPGSQDHIVGQLIAEYALPNVKMIEKAVLPYNVLNAADLLITKVSTLAIEAMYLNVPTIGIVLDNETFWEVYQNGIEYQRSVADLQVRLRTLLDDRERMLSWNEEMKVRQRYFLNSHGILSSHNTSRNVVLALKNKLAAGKVLSSAH
jgi:hypothetical protein